MIHIPGVPNSDASIPMESDPEASVQSTPDLIALVLVEPDQYAPIHTESDQDLQDIMSREPDTVHSTTKQVAYADDLTGAGKLHLLRK